MYGWTSMALSQQNEKKKLEIDTIFCPQWTSYLKKLNNKVIYASKKNILVGLDRFITLLSNKYNTIKPRLVM